MDLIDKNELINIEAKGAVEQIMWERDMAVQQLESYGVQLCENADCVRVVRCKDCFYYDNGLCKMIEDDDSWYEDDFCSYGRRKEWMQKQC